jgi:phenylacetate-coenzyme A ligase PaaK-like adenylate-forming protein
MTKALFFPMEKGRIVITLFNKAHPFIRYDIGDGILDEKSTLQRPILQQLIGRTMILLFYPVVKAPGLTFITLQKHYRGRWKCKRIYDQANQNRYFYNQICK